MVTIEFTPPKPGSKPCPCCGTATTWLTRFVYNDGDAYAIYYASFSKGHPKRHVSVLISLGEWGEDTPPSNRRSFYVRIRSGAEGYEMSVRDAKDSPWGDVPLFGRTLDRKEALADPHIDEVFHICDHIIAEDAPVLEYFSLGDHHR